MNRSKWLNEKTISIVLAVVVVFGTLIVRMTWQGTPKHPETKTSIYEPLDAKRLRNPRQTLNRRKPLSILFMVTAKNTNVAKHPGHLQSIMLITVNRQARKATMTSLPISHVVRLPDYGHHSSAALGDITRFDSSREIINAVQEDLKVPVDYYLMVTPSTVDKAVKQVNGVAVTPQATFTSHHVHFIRGKARQLDTREVRAFTARLRNDPQGVGGSEYRQRVVLTSMLQHADTYRKLVNRPFIAKISNRAVTNAHFSEILSISDYYRGASQHMKSNSLNLGAPSDRQRVSNLVRDNLNLKRKTVDQNH